MPGANGMVIDAKTSLPALPKMSRVTATATDDNVNITFDPVDGARDYRVYALPADKDISSDGSGHVTVKNAIYRCAGDRQAPATNMDAASPCKGSASTRWSTAQGRRLHAHLGRSDARLRLQTAGRRSRSGLRHGRFCGERRQRLRLLGHLGALG